MNIVGTEKDKVIK